MVGPENIRCFCFSYDEAEDIMHGWNEKCVPTYEGALVRGCIDDEPYEFAYILNAVKPKLGISPTAISIYSDVGYIYPRRGINVIVIDGIQEEF